MMHAKKYLLAMPTCQVM